MVQLLTPDAADRQPLRVISGHKEAVGLWMIERLPEVTALPGGYEAIGFARGSELVGGTLYTDFAPCVGGATIQMWGAGHDWLSRRVLKAMFGYPFVQLGCHRVWALTGRKNKACRHLLEGLGFKLEGVAREGYGPGKDSMLYGLLRSQCRWIET